MSSANAAATLAAQEAATVTDPTPPPAVTASPSTITKHGAPICPRQRIVLCCDGTWQARDTVESVLQGKVFTAKGDAWLTNIAILASAIAPDAGQPDENGLIIRQIVLYLPGVGTTVGSIQNLFEGATGASLADKVEDGYSFICDNYQEGDEIFCFGFSRGAYTARCICAFVNYAGILKKSELIWFRSIWEAYQKRRPDEPHTLEEAAETLHRYTGRYPSQNASRTSSAAVKEGIKVAKAPDAAVERVETKVSWAKSPPIQVLGVFDTVGSLGIPGSYMDPAVMKLYSFLDPSLGSNVKNAFHALALNEERENYTPTLWFQDPKEIRDEFPRQVLRQMWFPGEHSDVGGGWIDHGASDIALAWMVGQVMDTYDKPMLNIDIEAIRTLQDRRVEWAKQKDHQSRSRFESKKVRQVHQQFVKDLDRTDWANNVHVGYRHERLHHSVVASGKYDRATSPMFADLRAHDPARLEMLWAKAADAGRMTRTERALRWEGAERDQVQPLVGEGAGARGHAGNAPSVSLPVRSALHLPFSHSLDEAKHAARGGDASSSAEGEPRSMGERIRLAWDVVEDQVVAKLRQVALLPGEIKEGVVAHKEEEEKEAKGAPPA